MSDTLALISGTLLSLAFSYIPGLQNRFDLLSPTNKRLIMAGLLVLVSAAIFGLACLKWGAMLGLQLGCDQAGALGLVRALILALIANQSTYQISPQFKRR